MALARHQSRRPADALTVEIGDANREVINASEKHLSVAGGRPMMAPLFRCHYYFKWFDCYFFKNTMSLSLWFCRPKQSFIRARSVLRLEIEFLSGTGPCLL